MAFSEAGLDLEKTRHTVEHALAESCDCHCHLELGAASSAPSAAAESEERSLCIALFCRGEQVARASMTRLLNARPFAGRELQLARAIAEHAGVALGNALALHAERIGHAQAQRAVLELREMELKFTGLSASGILGIVVRDLHGKVVEINDSLLELLGYQRREILSGEVSWRALTPPEWLAAEARALEHMSLSRVGALREKEYVRKDGKRVPALVGSVLIGGARELVMSFVLDLTDRKEAQAAVERLRAERAADVKFRALLESAPDAMVIVDDSGTIVLVNGRVESLFGYSRTELIGQPIERLMPSRFRTPHLAHRGRYFREQSIRPMGAELDLYGERKDGSEFPIEVSLSPLQTETGLLVSSAIRDITDRRKADQQRARLAALVESSDDAIIGKTLGGIVTSWNRGAEHLFGYSSAEIIGHSISLIVPSEREPEFITILADVAKGDVRHLDTVRRRKDGVNVNVSLTVSPVRDVTGRVIGVSKVARDVTARRRAELALARAKDQAEAASQELEAFSYSVAHDLRAPLRGMNGFARLLLSEYEAAFDEQGKDWLNEILLNATRMGALIDALLSLSRVSRSELQPVLVDLSQVVRSIAVELTSGDRERVAEFSIQEGLRAELDPTLARAILENLLGNAWKFTQRRPRALIEFGQTTAAGQNAYFVRDNGAGFDMAYASKLFAPFQRLHSNVEYSGTGIGLATVQRIVRRHGGRIWAESALGEGATFYFEIPSRMHSPDP